MLWATLYALSLRRTRWPKRCRVMGVFQHGTAFHLVRQTVVRLEEKHRLSLRAEFSPPAFRTSAVSRAHGSRQLQHSAFSVGVHLPVLEFLKVDFAAPVGVHL